VPEHRTPTGAFAPRFSGQIAPVGRLKPWLARVQPDYGGVAEYQTRQRPGGTASERLSYGLISTIVPTGVTRQSSLISSSETAMHPAVQS